MIYSTRVQQPKVKESHIHEVPKNNGLILFFFLHGQGFRTVSIILKQW